MPEVARAKRPSSASLADIATTPTIMQLRISCGGGTHRICASRVCMSGPVKCELEEGSRLPKIPVLQDVEDVKRRLRAARSDLADRGCQSRTCAAALWLARKR